MKQKSRLLFVTSWLVLRLRWSLAFLQAVSQVTLQRLWSRPGIILFSHQDYRFPLDRWVFDEQRGAYLFSARPEEPLRICLLPEISQN
ncbi:MAG: hypothetical protein ONB44_23750 [candidate division KSB1 bacterium]|nr:hypothetical protein [candidate division KSB1 bacterium]MDZ7305158.1 hypothetical protein [candidate division KSB1 bacterium]MDZ7314242.1 hypothetical protein [candidate division KSB1 bacterium]